MSNTEETKPIEMELDPQPMPVTVIEAQETAQINSLISTAKRYPRSLTQCKARALQLATMDPDIAAECFYKLTRGGKVIEGPSIRLAEIIGSTWQNIRCGARTISENETTVTAQAFCIDLENNVYMAREVDRRITHTDGRRYNDDMIATTRNAACSIALRNAIFTVIPKAYVKTVYDAAKKVAVGDLKTLAERRGKAMDHFNKLGIDNARIFHTIGVKGIDDIGLEQLEILTGLKTAITEKETTLDEAFPTVPKVSKLVPPEDKKAKKKTQAVPTQEGGELIV